MFIGIVFHFLTKLAELEEQGVILTPIRYWSQHPYTSALVVVAAILVMALQYIINELTYSAALLTGVAANSMGDKLRARGGLIADKTLEQSGGKTKPLAKDDLGGG
jgi:hypothetical protein